MTKNKSEELEDLLEALGNLTKEQYEVALAIIQETFFINDKNNQSHWLKEALDYIKETSTQNNNVSSKYLARNTPNFIKKQELHLLVSLDDQTTSADNNNPTLH